MFDPGFADRRAAGRALADRLLALAGRAGVVILGLPRGGVPVAYEVARALLAPLDVFVVRKLGLPGQEELAMGALAGGGVCVVDDELRRARDVTDAQFDAVVQRERAELERRERLYRGDSPPLALRARTVILVDDGLATGSTMRAALRGVRQHDPARVLAAAPVGAPDTCVRLREEADEVVCVCTPRPFVAVGQWYADFDQTDDDEVRDLLARANLAHATSVTDPGRLR